jgi:uncharacterized membrane protein YkvA (DUF1232 family)
MKHKLADAVRRIRKEIEIYRSVASDPRCPKAARWLLGGAVAYALSPIDLIPDFIPMIGHLDDLIILPLLIWMAVRMIPKELFDQHRLSFETKDKASGVQQDLGGYRH